MLACAPLLAACSKTGSVGDGAGYELLIPGSATRTFISENDTTFRDKLAQHNIQCRKDVDCKK